jgi:hypothetical protein
LIVFATAIVLALAARVGLTESPVDLARRAGLRVLEGRHLTLVTDRPPRTDDGVEDLPRLFDEAFAAWCQHAGLDPAAHAEWRALGCLMMDREPLAFFKWRRPSLRQKKKARVPAGVFCL